MPDVFAGKNVNGEDVRELTGNVHLVQGNVLVCATGRFNIFQKRS